MRISAASALCILVVDDDEGAANALRRLLLSYGHDVHVSYDALIGLDRASKLTPDLILHDLAMAPVDGYEAARRLREFPSLSRTLLIACSGSVDEARASASGYDGWLYKPISDRDLETVIRMVRRRLAGSQPDTRTGAAE